MLKNYMDVNDEVKNRNNKFPKNNYFAHKWRVKDNFSKSIDRELFHQNVMGSTQYKTLMNNKILSLYKSRYTRNRSELIVDLAHKAMIFLEKRRYQKFTDAQTEVLLTNHTRGLVERVYNTLFAFTTELNSLLGLSELFVTATEPAFTGKENGRETIDSKVLARFTTNLYSLYIEGTKDRVKFYVLPADDLFALVDTSLEYAAACTWEATLLKDQQVQWRDKNGLLTDELLEITCVELLNQLLEQTKERIMPSKVVAEPKGTNFEYNAPDPWEMDQQRTIEATTLILDAIRETNDSQRASREEVVSSNVGTSGEFKSSSSVSQANDSSAYPPLTRTDVLFPNNTLHSPATSPSFNQESERIPQSDVGTTTSWDHPVLESSSVKAESYKWNGHSYEIELLTDNDFETVAKAAPKKKKTSSSKRRTSKRKRRK